MDPRDCLAQVSSRAVVVALTDDIRRASRRAGLGVRPASHGPGWPRRTPRLPALQTAATAHRVGTLRFSFGTRILLPQDRST